jgi:hypothetical protein
MSMKGQKIARPEWMPFITSDRTLKMAREDRLPKSIAGWMIVLACKHPLRCVYGSDLRAAWALLLSALWDKAKHPYDYLIYLWHRKEWEQEELKDMCEDVESEMKERES